MEKDHEASSSGPNFPMGPLPSIVPASSNRTCSDSIGTFNDLDGMVVTIPAALELCHPFFLQPLKAAVH